MNRKIMTKYIRIFSLTLCILLLLIFLVSCNNSEKPLTSEQSSSESITSEDSTSSESNKPIAYESVESEEGIYNFEKDYLSEEKRLEFILLCDQGILDAKNFLGDYVKNHKKITYYIESNIELSSQTFVDGSVELHGVKENMAEYIHETVHALLGYHNPLWIDEGIATYIDKKYTAWDNPPTYGEDINVLSHRFMFEEGFIHIERMSDEIMTSSDRFRAYVAAASLVEYIEKNFSREILLELHSDFDRADEILGVGFLQVKKDWLVHIENDY